MVDRDVLSYYALGLEERRLFVDGRPRLEYIRTMELLDRLLPAPPARILDVGGGAGVYAVPLCERGHSVHLIDPVELHVERVTELARERSLGKLTAVVGDARHLDVPDGAYDAVMLLGPLYHLTDRGDRVRALAEAARAAKPGGSIVAVGISRYASLLDGLKWRILNDETFRTIVERDLRDGQHRNPDPVTHPEFFTTAYLHLPAELESEALEASLRNVQLFAIEGIASAHDDDDQLASQLFAARATESEAALLGASAHIMLSATSPTEV